MQPLTTAKRLPRWDHTIIGFVGRLVPWKRPDIFIRAAGLLAERAKGDERIPGLVFVVTGEDEGGMTPDLKELAEQCGIADRCYFSGYRYPIEPVIREFAVLLATSEREPFGRTLIEAMGLGVPVVAAAAGGHLEIIEHERTGLLVPPNDPEAFADAAYRILTDETLADRLVDAALAHAGDTYSLAEHAGQVTAVYDDVLARRTRFQRFRRWLGDSLFR